MENHKAPASTTAWSYPVTATATEPSEGWFETVSEAAQRVAALLRRHKARREASRSGWRADPSAGRGTPVSRGRQRST